MVQIHCHLTHHSRPRATPLPPQERQKHSLWHTGEVGVRGCDKQAGCLDLSCPPAPSLLASASSKLRGRAPLGLGGHWLSPLYPPLLKTGSCCAPKSRTQECPEITPWQHHMGPRRRPPARRRSSAFPSHCFKPRSSIIGRTWCSSPQGLLGLARAESEQMGRAVGRRATRGHFSLYQTRGTVISASASGADPWLPELGGRSCGCV